MTSTTTITKPNPVEILTDLVEAGPTTDYSMQTAVATPVNAAQTQVLERTSTIWAEIARRADLPYEPLGYAPLFNEARLFEGGGMENNWIVQPADEAHEHQSAEEELTEGRVIVPRKQRLELERAREVGIRAPVIYIAHEVPKSRTDAILAEHGLPEGAPITPEQSRELVGPPPEPRAVADRAERLADRSTQMLKAAKVAALAAGVVIAAPVIAAGAAAASASSAVVYPVVIGAFPAGPRRVGTPAYYAILTRWEW
jgi:hypothetical protein